MRLSRDLDELKPSYDAIVVGSGYGAGVAASRLARMGLSVAVMERGREIPIGEFPDTLPEAMREFQYTLNGIHQGRRTGLFDLHVGEDMHVLVGCGLGGTSLINANVSLPPNVRVWEDPRWPHELFGDDTLNLGFERAEAMLNPKPWPKEKRLAKLDRMADAARKLGEDLSYPPINVTQEDVVNAAGVHQPACTSCGDCCSGCNVGAKTTVQMTYLPDAFNHGAEIFTDASVRSVRREADGWRVLYTVTSKRRDEFKSPERSVTASIVVLGAGSLGSTEILLRSREEGGLALSEHLGQGFTGNGDVLAFAWNGEKAAHSVGVGVPPKTNAPAPGPCITGALDLRDKGPLESGLIIEEGVLPSGLAEILPGIFNLGGHVFGKPTSSDLRDKVEGQVRRAESWMLGAWSGAMSHTSTFLVMAHDDGRGQLALERDRIRLHWPDVARQPVYKHINDTLTEASSANSATFIRNPIQNTFLGESLVTVHPLGGCGMGHDRHSGVIDHKCRVFDGQSADATAVHEGLYVVDGAAMPRPLGVNPLLTISAVAERAMIHLAQDINRSLDVATKANKPVMRLTGDPTPPRFADRVRAVMRNGVPFADLTGASLVEHARDTLKEKAADTAKHIERATAVAAMARNTLTTTNADIDADAAKPVEAAQPEPAPTHRPTGVEFTEKMTGHLSDRTASDYATAASVGQSRDQSFHFIVTVRVDDIDLFLTDPAHRGSLAGTASCPLLSPEPIDISDGVFHLMRKSGDAADTRLFEYIMTLTTREGRRFAFRGTKHVHNDHRPGDLWTDTTTLLIDIDDAASQAPVLRGTLRIEPLDFARQLATIKGFGGASGADRVNAVAKFGTLFAGTLYDIYGGIFAPAKRYNPDRVRKKRGLRAGTPQVHVFQTADGRYLRLTRYNRDGQNSKGPVLFAHGLGVSSLIFSIDTIDTNLLEYMTDRDFDCWLLDFRASIDLPYHRERWTADDCAQYDYQPAIDLIRSVTGRPSVQVIAHCFGSTTFVMSMLGGHLTGVRSAVLSQIATDIIVPFWPQRFLAHLRTPQILDLLGIDLVNARATTEQGPMNRFIDGFIRLAVPFRRDEISRNATSNRITALYGPLYKIEQLNRLTFDSGLAEMFGEANIDAFKHLGLLARRKILLDASGKDVYLPHLERLAFPITIIHGEKNGCFSPESTARTLDRLVARNGAKYYQRHVIPGYGHIDCIFGKAAATDVFPKIHAHLEETEKI